MKLECPFPPNHEYVKGTARFADADRSVITLKYVKSNRFDKSPDSNLQQSYREISGKEDYKTFNLPVDIDDPRFRYVIEECEDLDEIHQNTYSVLKDQRSNFEKIIMDIAKRDGLLFDLGLGDSKSYKNFLSNIFKPYKQNSNDDVNNLFAIKLDIFELPQIRESQNAELKRELRRAQTPLDIVQAAINIQYDNIKNGLEIQVEDNDPTNPSDKDSDTSD